MPSHTARTAPGWIACIGEPCDRKSVGSALAIGYFTSPSALSASCTFGPRADALLVIGDAPASG